MNPLVVQGAAQLLLSKYKGTQGMFMKNMLTMAATGLVIFAGLGWYLDWYKVSRTTTSDGKQHINFDVDTQRIKHDLKVGRDQATSFISKSGFPSVTPPANPGQPNQPFYPPATTPPAAYPPGYGQPGYPPLQQPGYPPGYQQPYPQQGQPQYPPQYPPPQQPPGFAPQGWVPASPTNRPNTGAPFQPIPGRPF